MSNRTTQITTKVVIPVVILLLVAIGGLAFFLTFRSVEAARESLNEQVSWISLYGQEAYMDLQERGLASAEVLKGLTELYASQEAPRQELLEAIRAPLTEQEWIVGTWVAFEPNAYDGSDSTFAGVEPFTREGRFASYWFRDQGAIASMGLDDYADEPYYSVPLDTARPFLSGAYTYEAGGESLSMVTVALPIDIDGETVGVVGIDLDLSSSQELITAITPLGTGYTFVVSDTGNIVAHPNEQILMTEASQYFERPDEFRQAIANRESYRETKQAVGGERSESLFVVSPFAVEGFNKTWFYGVSIPTAIIQQQVSSFIAASVIAGVVALVIALMVLLPLLTRITKPLRDSATAIAAISAGAGDLTQRLEVATNDEVGALSASFNKFIEYQNSFIKGLKANAQRAGDAKNEVVSSAEETSASIRQIGANVESISKQMGTLDATVNSSSAALEQTNASIQSIDAQISEQAAMLEEASSSINEISASLSSTARIAQQRVVAAEELNKTVQEGKSKLSTAEEAMRIVVDQVSSIEQMNALINNIAAQTNLLSMNAAIEAAHAGDSGRGFAVVAEEIRKLAGQAAESSKEINASVKQISSSIARSSETIRESSQSFDKIIEEAQFTGSALTEISASVEEMSAGGEEIMRATQALSDAVTKVNEGFQEIATSSRQLLAANGDLKNISGSTSSGIAEINIGVQEIVEAAGNLVGIAGNLDQVINELHGQVDQFRTE